MSPEVIFSHVLTDLLDSALEDLRQIPRPVTTEYKSELRRVVDKLARLQAGLVAFGNFPQAVFDLLNDARATLNAAMIDESLVDSAERQLHTLRASWGRGPPSSGPGALRNGKGEDNRDASDLICKCGHGLSAHKVNRPSESDVVLVCAVCDCGGFRYSG